MRHELTRRQLVVATAGLTAATFTSGCGGSRDDRVGETEPGSSEASSSAPLIPRPAGLVRTNWSADAFTLGSYSFMAAGATPDDRATLRRPIGGRIFFAGEHTNVDHPATVHGAMASGRRAADEVLRAAANGERVIVVGAGISGIVCAAALRRAAMQVVVLEARNRIGGRLDTVTPSGWSLPIDRGASWVHDVAASDLVERLAAGGVAAERWDWDAGRVSGGGDADSIVEQIESAVEAAIEAAELAGDDELDLAAATVDQLGADLDESSLERFFATEVVTEYGADAAELSARWALEEGSLGDDMLVTGGYQGLAIAEADGLDIRSSTTVTRIERAGDGVAVVTSDGTRLLADRVVVTVPLGVLQAELITFDPPLPDAHAVSLNRLGMGVLDKFWFRFAEPWWTEDASIWTIRGPIESPFVEWYNLRPLTGQPVLLALLGGQQARTWSVRNDEEVIDAALVALQHFADDQW